MYVSELASYNVLLSDFVPYRETSQDSQRVIYEDFHSDWNLSHPLLVRQSQHAPGAQKKKRQNFLTFFLNLIQKWKTIFLNIFFFFFNDKLWNYELKHLYQKVQFAIYGPTSAHFFVRRVDKSTRWGHTNDRLSPIDET